MLKDHAYISLLRAAIFDHLITDLKLTRTDWLHAGDHAQNRRLSGTLRAGQDNKLSIIDLQTKILHCCLSIWECLCHISK